jgi:hypothetical protein
LNNFKQAPQQPHPKEYTATHPGRDVAAYHTQARNYLANADQRGNTQIPKPTAEIIPGAVSFYFIDVFTVVSPGTYEVWANADHSKAYPYKELPLIWGENIFPEIHMQNGFAIPSGSYTGTLQLLDELGAVLSTVTVSYSSGQTGLTFKTLSTSYALGDEINQPFHGVRFTFDQTNTVAHPYVWVHYSGEFNSGAMGQL